MMKKIALLLIPVIALIGTGIALMTWNDLNASHSHSWSEWEVVSPATCVSKAIEERKCECGKVQTREVGEIDEHGHVFDGDGCGSICIFCGAKGVCGDPECDNCNNTSDYIAPELSEYIVGEWTVKKTNYSWLGHTDDLGWYDYDKFTFNADNESSIVSNSRRFPTYTWATVEENILEIFMGNISVTVTIINENTMMWASNENNNYVCSLVRV